MIDLFRQTNETTATKIEKLWLRYVDIAGDCSERTWYRVKEACAINAANVEDAYEAVVLRLVVYAVYKSLGRRPLPGLEELEAVRKRLSQHINSSKTAFTTDDIKNLVKETLPKTYDRSTLWRWGKAIGVPIVEGKEYSLEEMVMWYLHLLTKANKKRRR